MSNDRLTEIRIRGLRSLADVRLKLSGLTVLIGENGSGKSSLIEAFEILRKTTEPEFLSKLSYTHGGVPALLRQGAEELVFQVGARVGGLPVEYELALGRVGLSPVVLREELRVEWPGFRPSRMLNRIESGFFLDVPHRLPEFVANRMPGMSTSVHRTLPAPAQAMIFGARFSFGLSAEQESQLEAVSAPHPQPIYDGFARLLAGLHVQMPLAIRPGWTSRELGDRFSLRDAETVAPASSLARSAQNLKSCFARLKHEPPEQWARTMDLVRLGLGDDVEDVATPAVGGGAIALSLRLRGLAEPIFVEQLSDGQLGYLAFVALTRLPGTPSLIALDEPEAHLHPHLLVRVLELLEELAERCPVVLATHSDRLLDALPNPAKSVVLCELDRERATELRRPDPAALERWLERYRGWVTCEVTVTSPRS